MSVHSRSLSIAATMFVLMLSVALQGAWAQTPEQMEYERQQREYRQQQERQRQEQQRQQELMNENARRQQEESRRLNAPMGQGAAPAYQGAAPQIGGQRGAQPPAPQFDASAATAAARWEDLGSLPAYGGLEIYHDPVTMRRSGNQVKMWEMWDFKTAQIIDGKRVLSVKNLYEYDCKGSRRRMLATTGFSGHMGKLAAVGFGNSAFPWQPAAPTNYTGELWKIACAKK